MVAVLKVHERRNRNPERLFLSRGDYSPGLRKGRANNKDSKTRETTK